MGARLHGQVTKPKEWIVLPHLWLKVWLVEILPNPELFPRIAKHSYINRP